MGIYSESHDEIDMNALVEAFLIDDLAHNYSQETVQEFCAPGGIADALIEAKVLSGKRSVTRLSKDADFERRRTIAAIQIARAKNDPIYIKLCKAQLLRKQYKAKIVEKYGSKANKIALQGQKEYIKAMKGVNISNSLNGPSYSRDDAR